MKKKINAYISIEASFLFPTIIFIYYVIILAVLILMSRCLIIQNQYVIGLRAASFSYGDDEYGEVLFNDKDKFDKDEYIKNRYERIRKQYMGSLNNIDCSIYENRLIINVSSNSGIERFNSKIECIIINPVWKIRGLRN